MNVIMIMVVATINVQTLMDLMSVHVEKDLNCIHMGTTVQVMDVVCNVNFENNLL